METLVETRKQHTSIHFEMTLRILHLATQDQGGGGYDAAYRLHCNMRDAGVDSAVLVLTKQSNDLHVIEMSAGFGAFEGLRWLWSKLLFRYHRRCHTAA